MDQIDNFHIFLHRSLWAEILMPCFLSVFKDWEPNHLWSVLFFPLNRRQQLSGISMCVFPMSILIIYHFIILLFRYIWFLLIMSSSYCLEIFGFYLLISPHIILTITYHIYIIMFMLYQFLDSMRFLCFLLNMNQNHPTHSCCTAIKASTIDSHKNESAYLSGF